MVMVVVVTVVAVAMAGGVANGTGGAHNCGRCDGVPNEGPG